MPTMNPISYKNSWNSYYQMQQSYPAAPARDNPYYDLSELSPARGDYGASFASGIETLKGLGSFLGPIGGFGANLAAQMVMFNKQYDAQKHMYTDYMSPAAQMQQMRDAGINPNAAAEGIAGAGASMPSAPAMPAAPAPGLGGQLQDAPLAAADLDIKRAQEENIKANTQYTKSKDLGQTIDNAYAEERQQAALQQMYNHNAIDRTNLQMLQQDAFYHGAEAEQHFYQTVQATIQGSQQIQLLQQEFYNKMAEYEVLLTQAGLNRAQVNECYSRIGLNSAMIGEIGARINNINADTLLKGSQLTAQQIEIEMLGVKNYFSKETLRIYKDTGFNVNSPANMNYLTLAAQGKTKEAEALLGNMYDYSRGQYGARSNNTQKWINTCVGAIATIGGMVMMATGAGAVPGAALTAYGANKLTKTYVNNSSLSPSSNLYDTGSDWSWIGD